MRNKRRQRPDRARPPFGIVGKASALGILAVAGYGLTAAPALSPTYGGTIAYQAPVEAPRVAEVGGALELTGSVHSLFQSEGFTGPNSAAKVDRTRPDPNVVQFASLFDATRQHLASLDEPAKISEVPDLKLLLEQRVHHSPEQGPRMSLAAVDPKLMSAALDAINKAAGSEEEATGPAPVALPAQLAYARDTTPSTMTVRPRITVSEKQFNCLATAVYFEARGESYRGQAAVAQVVMNRVKHPLYPSTICGVVYQNQSKRNACQFSFACDGMPETINEPKAWATAKEVARKVLAGQLYIPEVANATHYHATYVYPRWARHMQRVTKIGLHVFYRFRSS